MVKLKITRETIRNHQPFAQVEASRGPKPTTWQCHVPQPKPSFACTIRGPR
jgi:hypothetical protein